MKKLKNFEDHTTVNFSDLYGSGRSYSNWSPNFMINKSRGRNPYVKGPDGMLVEVDPRKSVPKDTIYLDPSQVVKYNEITKEINKLKEEQNILFANREDIIS
jgi:hypothetical protein